jgi:ferritin-like metal-binding protein YciE
MATSKSGKRRAKDSPDGTELLVLELQQIHSAESQLARALPRLAKSAESEKLRQSLETRLTEGERILKDVETALEELEESPGRKKNVAAEGLIADAREHVQEIATGPALDEVLIAAIQKTEHYCIAAWGTARSLAQALDRKTVIRAMERALKEGKAYDEQLTQLAETEVMPALLQRESADENAEEERQDGSGRNRGSERTERRTST